MQTSLNKIMQGPALPSQAPNRTPAGSDAAGEEDSVFETELLSASDDLTQEAGGPEANAAMPAGFRAASASAAPGMDEHSRRTSASADAKGLVDGKPGDSGADPQVSNRHASEQDPQAVEGGDLPEWLAALVARMPKVAQRSGAAAPPSAKPAEAMDARRMPASTDAAVHPAEAGAALQDEPPPAPAQGQVGVDERLAIPLEGATPLPATARAALSQTAARKEGEEGAGQPAPAPTRPAQRATPGPVVEPVSRSGVSKQADPEFARPSPPLPADRTGEADSASRRIAVPATNAPANPAAAAPAAAAPAAAAPAAAAPAAAAPAAAAPAAAARVYKRPALDSAGRSSASESRAAPERNLDPLTPPAVASAERTAARSGEPSFAIRRPASPAAATPTTRAPEAAATDAGSPPSIVPAHAAVNVVIGPAAAVITRAAQRPGEPGAPGSPAEQTAAAWSSSLQQGGPVPVAAPGAMPADARKAGLPEAGARPQGMPSVADAGRARRPMAALEALGERDPAGRYSATVDKPRSSDALQAAASWMQALEAAAQTTTAPLERRAAAPEGPAPVSASSSPSGPATEPVVPGQDPVVAETRIDAALQSRDFAPALGARVAAMARDGVEQARISLNPAEMGPVSVQLELSGTQVRVELAAEVEATRLALEQALPALAGSLREAGFTLAGGGVFQQARDGGTWAQDARDQPDGGLTGVGRPMADPGSIAGAVPARSRGLVDLYA